MCSTFQGKPAPSKEWECDTQRGAVSALEVCLIAKDWPAYWIQHSMGAVTERAYPPTNSALDSLKGFPDSTVMMVQMSSSAATTKSYHLHSKHYP